MNLSKAKVVIIALLFAFNVFLLGFNVSYYEKQGVSKETINNAVTILKARGVTLSSPMPDDIGNRRLIFGNKALSKTAIAEQLLGPGYAESEDGLSYETDGTGFEAGGAKLVFSSGTSFVYTAAQPVELKDISTPERCEKSVRTYLKQRSLLNGKYITDGLITTSDSNTVVKLIESYNGFLVYDNTCTVTVDKTGIVRIEMQKLQIQSFAPEKVEDLAPAYEALLSNYPQDSNVTIVSMDLGYKFPAELSPDGLESLELLPVWRVKVKGSSEPVYLSTTEAGM